MHQGENDAESLPMADNYACTFARMIQDWRAGWSASSGTSPTFPFGLVQLCSWAHGNATAHKNATVSKFRSRPSVLVQVQQDAQEALHELLPPRAFTQTLTFP